MFLEEILASVDKRAAAWQKEAEAIRARALLAPPPRSLKQALIGSPRMGVIAECKHRSPSKGWLADVYDPVAKARYYQAMGASGISILTEPDYFAGSMEHLAQVRQAVDCPLLCKDFVRHPVQIYQARSHGADAVLLIVRIIQNPGMLAELHRLALELGMEALVEVHSETELEVALALNPELLGVNNRDLDSFETRLEFSQQIAPRIPDSVVAVSESGIRSAADLEWLRGLGYRAVLIGEALMRGGTVLEDIRR